jgi:hypothetical protein
MTGEWMSNSKLLDIADEGKIYGIPVEHLSYNQAKLAIHFAAKTEPWLLENIGEFGKDWFVSQDLAYDSLRLSFKDEQTEMYFKLAWMQRDHDEA